MSDTDTEPAIPAPPGIVSNLSNPKDVLHTVNLATQIVCIIVVTAIVGVRVAIRVRLGRGLGLEDYTTIAGWVLFIGFCANMLVLNTYGGGYHAWDALEAQFISFQKASYAITLLYIPMVFTIKLALLTIMLRIFSPDRRKVITIYISMIVLLLYYIPAFFIKVFFCAPISAYWTGTKEGTGQGSCMDQRKAIIADSVLSIASDLWILLLPMPMLWPLKMSAMKKIRVLGILGAGGLATGFSVWRLVMMVTQTEKQRDTTLFWVRAVLTANAEAGIGLICTCLPALSSYIAGLTTNTTSPSYRSGSFETNHELNSWTMTMNMNKNKLATSKIGSVKYGYTPSRVSSFPPILADQACLISTVEAERAVSAGSEGGKSGRGSGREEVEEGEGERVIHKDVMVEQSYEYVCRT